MGFGGALYHCTELRRLHGTNKTDGSDPHIPGLDKAFVQPARTSVQLWRLDEEGMGVMDLTTT